LQLISGGLVAPEVLSAGDGLGWRIEADSAPLVASETGADLLLFDLASWRRRCHHPQML
jgi:hypothetical protein